MQSIEESPLSVFQKVRQMMRLKRKLKIKRRLLSDTAAQAAQTQDRTASAALARLSFNAEIMEEDVREAASKLIHPTLN